MFVKLACILNFSFLGELEDTWPGMDRAGGWLGWGGSHTDYKTNLSSQLNWHCTCQLELSLAIIELISANDLMN